MTTFMTYNIRVAIQEGTHAIARVINAYGPDVVALQEVGRHWVMGPTGDTTRALARLCGYPHHVFVPSIEWFGPAQYGHALLSRFPIVAPTIHRLPQNTDEPRTALLAEIAAPLPFDVVTTHLSHVDDRHAQGPVLFELAKARSGRAIVLGDLNEADTTKPWLAELRREFADAFPHDAPPTFPSSAPERRIDYLLARGGRWTEKKVVEDHDLASDHRALFARLDWG